MIKLSEAVEEELKTSVVQACEVEHGKYGTHTYIHFYIYIEDICVCVYV
jgi:hypothetical protein